MDLEPTEPLLRSLSHDLKEPIRSIRRRLNNVLESAGGADFADEIEFLDNRIGNIGDDIKKFRTETKRRPVSFATIQDFLENHLLKVHDHYKLELQRSQSRFRSANPEVKAELRVIVDNSARLRRRLEALLNYTKAKGELSPSQFGLANEAQRVVAELTDLLTRTHTSIHIYGGMNIYADQLRVAQLFQNAIHNSVRYSRKNVFPIIEITISDKLCPHSRLDPSVRERLPIPSPRDRRYAYLSIADNGQGIEPGQLEAVFGLFVRGNGEPIDNEAGTGIGLAIVQSIAHAHHGAAWLTSKFGSSTTLHVVLTDLRSDFSRR